MRAAFMPRSDVSSLWNDVRNSTPQCMKFTGSAVPKTAKYQRSLRLVTVFPGPSPGPLVGLFSSNINALCRGVVGSYGAPPGTGIPKACAAKAH